MEMKAQFDMNERILYFVMWTKWKHDDKISVWTLRVVTEVVKKSRKCSQPHTSIPHPASWGGYHRNALHCNFCANKLQALLAAVSLIMRNKGNKKSLSTPQNTYMGLHFQLVGACRKNQVCVHMCASKCVDVYMSCHLWHWNIKADGFGLATDCSCAGVQQRN